MCRPEEKKKMETKEIPKNSGVEKSKNEVAKTKRIPSKKTKLRRGKRDKEGEYLLVSASTVSVEPKKKKRKRCRRHSKNMERTILLGDWNR